MIKLGVNSVLFGGYDLATAAQHIKAAGYDGIELSAIKGMCEHLVLDDWQSQAADIKQIVADNGLQLLSMEVASLDPERLEKAFAAGAAIGVPIINVGPGGKMNVDEDLERQTDLLVVMSERAAAHGVTLVAPNAGHWAPTVHASASVMPVDGQYVPGAHAAGEPEPAPHVNPAGQATAVAFGEPYGQ